MMKNRYLAVLLTAAVSLAAAGCALSGKAVMAADLTKGVKPANVTGRPADDAFVGAMADFSVELFKKSAEGGKSSLISPLSVTLALSMTANGARGDTLAQMERLLGEDIPLPALNEYLYAYASGLPSTDKATLKLASSIWFRDDDSLGVKPEFLQKNAGYYGAAAYKGAFDGQTVKDVNAWVSENTAGMIKKILEGIDPEDMLYLINAVTFQAEWKNVYYKENVREGVFTGESGAGRKASFMYSGENQYLDDGLATGFVKPYANGYSFAALLPNKGVSMDEYISSLSGAGFLNTLKNAQSAMVNAALPKFSYDCTITMNDALCELGIPDAFDAGRADFGDMAALPDGNLYISQVLHKTFISVDELGTKAGAVTMVAVAGGSAPTDTKTVRLDRPFVYAIIDNATNLPVFIGTVMAV